jgi:nucleoside-diphosphate-sugar epimerase
VGKTLVTGATGFAGGHLCRRLARNGDRIVAFVRRADSRSSALEALGVECRAVDIRDRDKVLDRFSGISRVFHLAAAFRAEPKDRGVFRAVNVEGTRNLLDAAREASVERFVHCSTVGVQGRIDDPPASEEYRLGPGDHYQASKAEGEILAREYFAAGLPGVVVRPAGLYGPGDLRFLKLFRSIRRGWFVMIGRGDTLYHFTYIDDFVDGVTSCGSRREAIGEVFTIAGAEHTTVRDFVNGIADALGRPHPRLRVPSYPVLLASRLCESACRVLRIVPPLYPRRLDFFREDRAFRIDKARNLLGYRPGVPLQEGLRRTAVWYRERGLL